MIDAIFAQNINEDINEQAKIEINLDTKIEDNIEKNIINKEEVFNMLKEYNDKTNYYYQGDELVFEVLLEKGLSGYLYLIL